MIQEEAELHMSSGPSSSPGWLQLWGSQGNFSEQGEEGGTNPSIPEGLCAVGQLEQALLRLCSGFTLHGYLLVAGLVFNPVTFAAGAGCAPLCLLTCRYLTETMELLGVLAW